MESSHTKVRPVSPAAPYIGGKRNLARRLCALIEATPHDNYVEPFVGMGGVFLRRSTRPRAEVINDLSRDVTTLFRILQRHYQAFMDMLKWQMTSREEFERLVAVDPDTLTDLERAARFLYLQRLAFGGKVNGRNFGVDRRTPARFDVTKLAPMLEEIHDRLAGVKIERLPYADLIRRYDGPGTLFYLDPPIGGARMITAPGRSGGTTSRSWRTSSATSPGASSCRSMTRPALARCSAGSRSMRWRRRIRSARLPAAACGQGS